MHDIPREMHRFIVVALLSIVACAKRASSQPVAAPKVEKQYDRHEWVIVAKEIATNFSQQKFDSLIGSTVWETKGAVDKEVQDFVKFTEAVYPLTVSISNQTHRVQWGLFVATTSDGFFPLLEQFVKGFPDTDETKETRVNGLQEAKYGNIATLIGVLQSSHQVPGPLRQQVLERLLLLNYPQYSKDDLQFILASIDKIKTSDLVVYDARYDTLRDFISKEHDSRNEASKIIYQGARLSSSSVTSHDAGNFSVALPNGLAKTIINSDGSKAYLVEDKLGSTHYSIVCRVGVSAQTLQKGLASNGWQSRDDDATFTVSVGEKFGYAKIKELEGKICVSFAEGAKSELDEAKTLTILDSVASK